VLRLLPAPEDRRFLRSLFGIANAPDRLYRFDIVVQNLQSIIGAWETPVFFATLPNEVRDALPKLERLFTQLAGLRASRDIRYVIRCAPYAALACSPLETPAPDEFRLLQAHFLLSVYLYFKKQFSPTGLEEPESNQSPLVEDEPGPHRFKIRRKYKTFVSSLYQASLAIRDLALGERGQTTGPGDNWANDFLVQLPLEDFPRKFARTSRIQLHTFDRSLGESSTGANPALIRPALIARFLSLAHGLRKPHARGHSDRAGGTRINIDLHGPQDSIFFGDAEIIDPYGDLTPPPNEPRLSFKYLEESEEREHSSHIVRVDNCPNEFQDELLLSWRTANELFKTSRSSFKGFCVAQQNHVIRYNKVFPFANDRLLRDELRSLDLTLRTELDSRLSDPHSFGRSVRIEIELRLIALIMLWTGSNLDRVISLICVDSVDDHDEAELAYVNSCGCFRSEVDFPSYRQAQEDAEGLNRQQVNYFAAPDIANLGGLIAQFRRLTSRKSKKRDGTGDLRLFKGTKETYHEHLTGLLRDDRGNRLTETRLSNALFTQVLNHTGKDVVAATIIGGARSQLCRVPMFYACRSVKNIQNIYADVVRQCCSNPTDTPLGTEHQTKHQVDELGETLHIGIRLCPTKAAVSSLVQELKDTLSERIVTSEDRIRYHNTYTLYTILYFGIGTAIRAVRDPLVRPSEVSPDTQLALISDKDTDSGTKGRLALIVPPLIKQLQNYADHIAGNNPQRVHCYFLNDWRREVGSPKTIAKHLPRWFRVFPTGFNRRFTFNELLEARCPPEIVRILVMGHAVLGDEAWSKNSTFSYASARLVLGDYLERLLSDLKFVPIESRLK
jgi:hypothetical protein